MGDGMLEAPEKRDVATPTIIIIAIPNSKKGV
jgi:hypothetical protein